MLGRYLGGALTALAIGLLIGLVGLALGANEAAQYVDWEKAHFIGLAFSTRHRAAV
jgi:hypothetical protein